MKKYVLEQDGWFFVKLDIYGTAYWLQDPYDKRVVRFDSITEAIDFAEPIYSLLGCVAVPFEFE